MTTDSNTETQSHQLAKTATCMCGAVRFQIDMTSATDVTDGHVTSCHCKMCRNWTGGMGFMAVTLPSDCLTYLSGEDKVRHYESSPWGCRAFCTECGSSLFWKAQAGTMIQVAAGLFDTPDWLEHRHQIFVDDSPAWHILNAQCTAQTGAEFLDSLERFE